MVKSREESERDPAHSVCFAVRATVALQLRDAGEQKERGREKLGGVEEEGKTEGEKKNKREEEQAALVFCHTPSGILCYL